MGIQGSRRVYDIELASPCSSCCLGFAADPMAEVYGGLKETADSLNEVVSYIGESCEDAEGTGKLSVLKSTLATV